ncbi:MAG TPA: hypothetical protein DCE41_00070 [Cytophagales bacterium]|nr:hypothetical protein [Cytophagales bacterium]HAA18289.1 hypothetical protein [Cytophagales bacterium]HAP61999.1 hypothetical protein [Cytophagales bacterium]
MLVTSLRRTLLGQLYGDRGRAQWGWLTDQKTNTCFLDIPITFAGQDFPDPESPDRLWEGNDATLC